MQFVVDFLIFLTWHFQEPMHLPSSLSCVVHCTFHSANMNVHCHYSNFELSQMAVSGFLLQLTCD
jgi:hypothetical protein